MKKSLLIILTLFVGLAGQLSGQALLKIDSSASFGIKFDTLGPKHRIVVGYKIINVAKHDSDSLTKGLKFYTNLRINSQKFVSHSKGKIIKDNMKPYFKKKDFMMVYDTVILDDSVKIPPYGTNVIVIWPTGNGVHAMFMYSAHYFQVTYTAIEPIDERTDNSLKIYPNPASDIIHFETLKAGIELRKVIIRDMTGKELINRNDPQKELDISALPKGCYILHVHFSDGSAGIYKVMKVQ